MVITETDSSRVKDNSAVDQIFQFEKCEVILWKDGVVTITSSQPKSPVISFRRAPNPWCGNVTTPTLRFGNEGRMPQSKAPN
jgi:hypothetical protein